MLPWFNVKAKTIELEMGLAFAITQKNNNNDVPSLYSVVFNLIRMNSLKN